MSAVSRHDKLPASRSMLHLSHIRIALSTFSLISVQCYALKSSDCAALALSANDAQCPSPVCGSISLPDDETPTFLESLSPQCQILMHKYRTAYRPPNEGKLGYGFNSTVRNYEHRHKACPGSRFAMMATNPVVVEAPDVKGFVLCTVPHSGCTNLRKLINAVTRYPESPPADPLQQFKQAHFSDYSTLWHYGLWEVPADVYPSFMVGRNPYVRLLSAFLTNQAHEGQDEDAEKADHEEPNGAEDVRWRQESIPQFHSFVHRLKTHDVAQLNRHFRMQLDVCASGLATYEYFLPIEDMGQWFPCWEEGLGLQKFTAQGWATSGQAKTWLGGISNDQTLASERGSCWWKPHYMDTCEEFYQATHPNWTVGHWDRLNNSNGSAIPWAEDTLADTAVGPHGDPRALQRQKSLAQASAHASTYVPYDWKQFYTQQIGDIVYKLYQRDFEAFGYAHETFAP